MVNTMSSNPPWNFSWVDKGKVAAMACPETEENIRFLLSQGIHNLVTLSPEKRPFKQNTAFKTWTVIPVEEFEAPSLNQIIEFISVCERCQSQSEIVGVHCRQGRGRTGVMAACYLVKFQQLPPDSAISNLRIQRPGSVETYSQERSIREFYDYLRRSQ